MSQSRRIVCAAVFSVCLLMLANWAWHHVTHVQPNASSSEVAEFKVGAEGRVLVIPGNVNGKPAKFLVDTGASRSLFDVSFLSELGESTGSAPVNTSGGQIEIAQYPCPAISLGPLQVKSSESVFCLDLENLRLAANETFSAVLGMDILSQYVMHVNFDNGTLSFGKSTEAFPQSLGSRFPLSFESSNPYATLTCGSVQGTFLLDTAGMDCCINRKLFNELASLGELECGPGYAVQTAVGVVAARTGLVNKFSIGSFEHENIICAEADINVLGLPHLSRFEVTFDFPNGDLYLKQGRDFAKAQMRGTSGLSFIRSANKLIVSSIKPGGSAETAGVKPGDQVVEIDGEDTNNIDMFRVRQLLTAEPGRAVKVRLVRSNEEFTASLLINDRLYR